MFRYAGAFITALILCGFACVTPSAAQNTGGVFGPVVNEDHAAAQYRITVDPDNDRWAQRLHIEKAVSDDVMLRVVGQTVDGQGRDFDIDYIQGEMFWQITPNDQAFQTGLRFDARIRPNGAEQLGLNWMNQWRLNDGWSARALLLSTVQVGENTSDDVFLGARGQMSKRLDSGVVWGGELYTSLGSTDDLTLFKRTGTSVGPFVSVPIGGKRSVFLQPLIGVTNSAPDAELRLWLTQNF